MAILKGDIKFTGKIGGLVSRKVNGKYVLSTPGGFTSERLEKGRKTNYKPTFQQASEFGMSSTFSKGIYRTLKSILGEDYTEKKTYKRLMSKVHRSRIYDKGTEKGKRRPTIHTLNLLRNFHFNLRALTTWLKEPEFVQDPSPAIKLNNIRKDIKWPNEADRIRLIAIHLQVDLVEIAVTPINAEYFEIDRNDAEAKKPFDWMLNPIPQKTLTALAVEFYQEVNGYTYQLFNRDYTPLHIVNYKE